MTPTSVAEHLDLPWAIELEPERQPDDSIVYVARNPELEGVMSHGSTPEQALVNLREARALALQVYIEAGWMIPQPRVLTPA